MTGQAHPTLILPWLRAHSRGLAMCAVFALALQMIAAFGHVHLVPGGAATAHPFASIAKSVASGIAAVADESALHKVKLPTGADHDPACAICLASSLVAAAVTASAPALVLPIAYLLLGPPTSVVETPFRNEPTAFWSRGPPLS